MKQAVPSRRSASMSGPLRGQLRSCSTAKWRLARVYPGAVAVAGPRLAGAGAGVPVAAGAAAAGAPAFPVVPVAAAGAAVVAAAGAGVPAVAAVPAVVPVAGAPVPAWVVALVWRPCPCAGGGETRLASRWSLRRLRTSRSLMAGVLLGGKEEFSHESENS